MATFLASSLFHEWLLTSKYKYLCCCGQSIRHCHELTTNIFVAVVVGLFYNAEETGEYVPSFGGSTAFLLWNGLVLTAESRINHLRIFQWMKYTLPKPIRTCLVIMLGLPVAHWFCDPYSMTNFFQHGQLAFPMILPIDPVEVTTVLS